MTSLMAYIHLNHILASPSPDYHRNLGPQLELVHLQKGQLLYDNGQRITHAYFPGTAVLSLMLLMESGATIEIASVGSEGFIGLPLVMGSDVMPSRVEVRSSGFAYRIRSEDLLSQVSTSPGLQQAILFYAQSVMTFISQSSACNRHHSVLQQLCRWLLVAMDRSQHAHLAVTQQSIANMLGVRREGVTEAAGKLEQAGIIRHSRGHITIIDRRALEASCCECYAIVSGQFERFSSAAAAPEAPSPVALDLRDQGTTRNAFRMASTNGAAAQARSQA